MTETAKAIAARYRGLIAHTGYGSPQERAYEERKIAGLVEAIIRQCKQVKTEKSK